MAERLDGPWRAHAVVRRAWHFGPGLGSCDRKEAGRQQHQKVTEEVANTFGIPAAAEDARTRRLIYNRQSYGKKIKVC